MRSSLREQLHAAVDALVDTIEALRAEPIDDLIYVSPGPLPPGRTREYFNRRCNRGLVSDAERVAGRGRGYWRCSRAAWHRSELRGASPAPLRIVPQKTDADLAAEMIAAAGFRMTRGSR